jgi:hypothetical protein
MGQLKNPVILRQAFVHFLVDALADRLNLFLASTTPVIPPFPAATAETLHKHLQILPPFIRSPMTPAIRGQTASPLLVKHDIVELTI